MKLELIDGEPAMRQCANLTERQALDGEGHVMVCCEEHPQFVTWPFPQS